MKRSLKTLKSDIGIVLCDCGGTLAERLDFAGLRKSLADREGVAGVQLCSGCCRPGEATRVIRALAAQGSRRIVVGACPREVYESALVEAMSKVRLNPGLAVEANIREHCAWVHADKAVATAKALDLLAAAVRNVALAEAVTVAHRKILCNALILGGGSAGMQAALSLSSLGHAVTLVTRSDALGGCAEKFPDFFGYLADDAAGAAALLKQDLDSIRARIKADKRIRWIAGSVLQSVSGEVGRFAVTLSAQTRSETIKAGAIVLAVGSLAEFPLAHASSSAAASQPEPAKGSHSVRNDRMQTGDAPHGAGQDGASRIWSLADLAETMRQGAGLPRSVAIILDLNGEQGRAVNALALSAAEQLAAMRRRRVVLYCRHVRVAAWGLENLYRRVRAAGVPIFRYEQPPVFAEDQRGVTICALDPQSGARIEELFEAVVMAHACPQNQGDRPALPRTLRRGPADAWQADNIWLLSSKSNQPGIYVVGAARGNSELREARNDATAAAGAIHQLLGIGQALVRSDAPVVDAEKCVLCLTCLRSCPHGAIEVDNNKKAAAMSAIACQRCGLCATLCPARAIRLPWCSDEQLDAALTVGPTVTVFACENSAWPAANAAGAQRLGYGAEVRLVRVPCAGRVDERQVLGALERGAARVLILGCHREACRYLLGADHAAKRVERLKAVLAKAGLDPARVGVGSLAEFETGRFLEFVKG